jgi:methylmalonyl-CoA mutase N-terminal domain/subunit
MKLYLKSPNARRPPAVVPTRLQRVKTLLMLRTHCQTTRLSLTEGGPAQMYARLKAVAGSVFAARKACIPTALTKPRPPEFRPHCPQITSLILQEENPHHQRGGPLAGS